MCRGLRESWDVDTAVERILALHVGAAALEAALESARRLNERDPTVATARAEVALSHALARTRAGRHLETGYDELLQVDPRRQGDSVDDVIARADRELQEALDRYNEDDR